MHASVHTALLLVDGGRDLRRAPIERVNDRSARLGDLDLVGVPMSGDPTRIALCPASPDQIPGHTLESPCTRVEPAPRLEATQRALLSFGQLRIFAVHLRLRH